MKKQIIALVGVIIACSCVVARADHPTVGFSAGLAGPAITIPATTLPKGSGAVTLRVEYVKFRTFSDAELARFAAQGTEVHSVDYLLSPSVGAGYGLTDDLTVGLRLPYLLRTDIRSGHNEGGEVVIDTHGNSDGVGDLTVLGQYRFVNNQLRRLECALLVGIKTPTGATGVKDLKGELFETEHQPGSGSWDPLLGMAASKRLGAISFDANVLYTFATGGAQRTNLGDRLHYNLATSYRLGNEKSHLHSDGTAEHQHLEWDLILEVNGEWQEKQTISNVVDDNSGGSLVYFSPGARLCGDNGWAATLSVGIPVIGERNGVQHETDIRMVFGLSKGF
ncbi:MAG: transporter [Desulfuromonadaceae bacterium]|nr:transporter [Desulfuromonadaceae bacterium]